MFRYGIPLVLTCLCGWSAPAIEPLQVRMETLTVPPATGPLVYVVARNNGTAEYQGTLSLTGPDTWQLSPELRPLSLAAGAMQRIAFNVAQGRNVAANQYPFEITLRSPDQVITQPQQTFVASAPYFKVAVDGRADEWQDAIPVTFSSGGRQTTVSTCWNRRRFCLLVAVQEDQLLTYQAGDAAAACDAVQFAVTPLEAPEPASAADLAGRFEFLLVARPDGTARCYQLAEPASRIEACLQPRPLKPCGADQVEVAVHREGDVTYYECALAFTMFGDQLRPSEGREFYFSVLVHDPDGSGLRDLGQAAGLWPTAADRMQWSDWPGAHWPAGPPLGNRLRWGLCTSKY